jgi:hypothetical protein
MAQVSLLITPTTIATPMAIIAIGHQVLMNCTGNLSQKDDTCFLRR